MKGLKKFFKRFEAEMVAVAFAEAGDPDTARMILQESKQSKAEENKKTSKGLIAKPLKP